MKKTLIIILVVVILGVGGYYLYNQINQKSNNGSNSISSPVNSNNLSLSEANNQFAISLYSQIKKENENLLFSPYSIVDAFGMVYEGAKGNTAQQIANVFQFISNDQKRRDEFASFQEKLNSNNSFYDLKSANALWIEKTYSILDDYLKIVQKYYNGDAQNVDFKNNPETARLTINKWVEDQTNNKIKNLFGQKTITEDNKLVLTNAVYFKGEWVNKFYPSKTYDDKFTTSSGNTVDIKMMSINNDKTNFSYYEDNNLQILKMPYAGDQLSMTIFLPTNNNLTSLEKSLTTTNLEKWNKELTSQPVNVYLPKFTFDDKYDLVNDLKQMGITDSFNGYQANFSGISKNNDLYISTVVHQAYIGVNELGTEAAAATGIGMAAMSAIMEPPKKVPVFKADHPFIFTIQDDSTGTILFMGAMNNPSL